MYSFITPSELQKSKELITSMILASNTPGSLLDDLSGKWTPCSKSILNFKCRSPVFQLITNLDTLFSFHSWLILHLPLCSSPTCSTRWQTGLRCHPRSGARCASPHGVPAWSRRPALWCARSPSGWCQRSGNYAGWTDAAGAGQVLKEEEIFWQKMFRIVLLFFWGGGGEGETRTNLLKLDFNRQCRTDVFTQ